MRLFASPIMLLPALASANMVWRPEIAPTPTPTQPLTSEQTLSIPSITSIPESFTSSPVSSSSHIWDPVVSQASHLLDELDEHLHIDLRKRQGAVSATNIVSVGTQPTQMPPVTVYDMRDGKAARTYTQLFVAVPDQWSSPSAGAIGLGTIQGTIGVVKSESKRDLLPEPTAVPTRQTFTIKGREVTMS